LSYIGAIIYQIFTDGMMRFIHDIQSSHPIDKEQFISLLSRLIGELESHRKAEELFQQPHPMIKAATLFNEMDKYPNAFPIFPRTERNDHHNNFIQKHKSKGDDER